MSAPLVHIANLTVNYQQKSVLQNLSWTINRHDNWLLCGNSGQGKTTLAKSIAGLIPSAQQQIQVNFDPGSNSPARVYYVSNWYYFKDLEGGSNFYYQQRYQSQSSPITATVKTEFENFGRENKLQWNDLEEICTALSFSAQIHSTLIQLSSGEHKKLQLVKALWLKPQLLVLDQPYNGLDAISRKNLNTLLENISTEGTGLIIVGYETELPSTINRFAEIKNGKLLEISKDAYKIHTPEENTINIPTFLHQEAHITTGKSLIKMVDVNISYSGKQVLKGINWEVLSGEKWLLQGHNGSGKSTLLSLICGDHPQAYANNFYLFGNKRGTGESIWDIKKRIGLISPELHWYFDANATVRDTITSGFFDTSGLFCDPGATKYAQADELIDYFGLTQDKHILTNLLPLGKQRLALLARTLIKNPEILILDEPCQGLDQWQTRHFNKLVDEICTKSTTLLYVGHFETQLPDCLDKRILLSQGSVQSIETAL